MAWYIEYDFYPFNDKRCKPERRLFELDCPDNISVQKQAQKEARKQLKTYPLTKPKLVWQEKIKESD